MLRGAVGAHFGRTYETYGWKTRQTLCLKICYIVSGIILNETNIFPFIVKATPYHFVLSTSVRVVRTFTLLVETESKIFFLIHFQKKVWVHFKNRENCIHKFDKKKGQMSIIRQILHLLLFPLSSFRHIHFGRSSLLHVIKPEINFLLSPHLISALFEKLDIYNL